MAGPWDASAIIHQNDQGFGCDVVGNNFEMSYPSWLLARYNLVLTNEWLQTNIRLHIINYSPFVCM
jgi:hypothetical protein